MKVLAFDMTGKRLTVGVANDTRVLGRWDAPADRQRGTTLDSLIGRALAEMDWRRTDIDGLALATGPGSLTATRIGWATASGWALARDIPVTGWPTPEIQRRWWQDHDLVGELRTNADDRGEPAIYCMIHHRGDEFYCYAFGRGQSRPPRPAVAQLGQWQPPAAGAAWIVGPGVLGYRERWIESLGASVQVVSEEYAVVGGDQLARWATEDFTAGRSLPVTESPLDYGLPPQFRKAS
jgi:tRNA threonylcarbamoyl adenosine modification protein YeaZ